MLKERTCSQLVGQDQALVPLPLEGLCAVIRLRLGSVREQLPKLGRWGVAQWGGLGGVLSTAI